MDCSPPGSSLHEILQARILEWVHALLQGNLPDSGIQPVSPLAPSLQADSLLLSHQGSPNLSIHCLFSYEDIFTLTIDKKGKSTILGFFKFKKAS